LKLSCTNHRYPLSLTEKGYTLKSLSESSTLTEFNKKLIFLSDFLRRIVYKSQFILRQEKLWMTEGQAVIPYV